MAYIIVSFGPYSCSGISTAYPKTPYTINTGTIVSIGFQNQGNATDFWASQMFVLNQTQAYLQVVNDAVTTTNYTVIVVVDIGDGSAADNLIATLPEMQSAPLKK